VVFLFPSKTQLKLCSYHLGNIVPLATQLSAGQNRTQSRYIESVHSTCTLDDISFIFFHRYYFLIFNYYTIFKVTVNDMGSHWVHTFYVPRLCSILALRWLCSSQNMLSRW